MLTGSTYKIYPQYNLVVEFHTGNVTPNDYIEFKKKLFKDPFFKPNMPHLVEMSEVNYNFKIKEFFTFFSFMEKNKKKLGKRKIAIITSSPKQVVTGMIYKTFQSILVRNAEIFTGRKTAINWLLNNEFTENIDTVITELKKSLITQKLPSID